MRKLKTFIILTAAFSGLLIGQSATAQYPSPVGSVSVLTSDANPAPGSDVILTANVLNSAGGGQEGVPVLFALESEDGTNGVLGSKSITKLTDAQGVATTVLHVGPTPGTMVVSVSGGGLQSRVVIQVGGGALPPAAPVDDGASEISPPSTGDGGLR